MQLVFLKNSLLWFNSYLHNRKQCVIVQGKLSDLLFMKEGLPQGSVLGSYSLFLFFINDLPPNYFALFCSFVCRRHCYLCFKSSFNPNSK